MGLLIKCPNVPCKYTCSLSWKLGVLNTFIWFIYYHVYGNLRMMHLWKRGSLMLSWGSYFTHEQKLTISIAVTCFNAGLLRKDAEMKKDKHILRHKRGRDCVSIEVRYHKSCYPNYTRPIATPEQQSSSADKELLDASFCATIVEQKILQKKVYRMTELHEKYMKMAGSQDPNMRVDKLETLLKKKFPMLIFQHSAQRNESTFVYCESGWSRALENTFSNQFNWDSRRSRTQKVSWYSRSPHAVQCVHDARSGIRFCEYLEWTLTATCQWPGYCGCRVHDPYATLQHERLVTGIIRWANVGPLRFRTEGYSSEVGVPASKRHIHSVESE